MIFNSENSQIRRILIQTKCHKIPGSVVGWVSWQESSQLKNATIFNPACPPYYQKSEKMSVPSITHCFYNRNYIYGPV